MSQSSETTNKRCNRIWKEGRGTLHKSGFFFYESCNTQRAAAADSSASIRQFSSPTIIIQLLSSNKYSMNPENTDYKCLFYESIESIEIVSIYYIYTPKKYLSDTITMLRRKHKLFKFRDEA
jgi:hypothetical protein